MIDIINLNKRYKDLKVLKNISLSFNKGEITALSGPNGSGKTTLVKSILGMVITDSGDILIDNNNIKKDIQYRDKIGYISQNVNFPENSKVQELIHTICALRDYIPDLEYFYKTYELTPHLNKKFKQLSGGTKKKINTILGLMFDFDIIIADEPSVGLDPTTRFVFKNTLLDLKKQGKTIIIVTHLLNEIEDIADNIIYFLDGEILINSKVNTLTSSGMSLEEIIAKKVNRNEQIN